MADDILTPSNPNFLAPTGFEFRINRAKELTFYLQSATLPGVQLIDSTGIETPFVRQQIPGTKLAYEAVSFTFKVDEDMLNYVELYNWIVSLGFPDDFSQATAFETANQDIQQGMFSDGTLNIMTAAMNPNIEVVFRDMYPTGLSNIDFDTKVSDIDHIDCAVTFAYMSYTIKKL